MKIDLDKMVTQAEAAEIRGVSVQAINYLVKNGRLRSVKVAGRVLLFRDEVEKFKPSLGGRPKGKQSAKRQSRQRKSN
jgi:excisionase family DNA binding protein